MAIKPDRSGRVAGTTYPSSVAPSGAQVLLEKRHGVAEMLMGALLKANVQIMRPRPGDVLVVRAPEGLADDPEFNQKVIKSLGASGFPGVPVILPIDCQVHVEPGKLQSEDKGYRATKNYGTDAAPNKDDRGVHIGVAPNPMSEGGDDDPCSS